MTYIDKDVGQFLGLADEDWPECPFLVGDTDDFEYEDPVDGTTVSQQVVSHECALCHDIEHAHMERQAGAGERYGGTAR